MNTVIIVVVVVIIDPGQTNPAKCEGGSQSPPRALRSTAEVEALREAVRCSEAFHECVIYQCHIYIISARPYQ